MGHPMRRSSRRGGLPPAHRVFQLSRRTARLLAGPVRRRRHRAGHRRGAGGGGARERQHPRSFEPRATRHGLAGSVGWAVRLRHALHSDGLSPNRAGVGARSRDPGRRHARDHHLGVAPRGRHFLSVSEERRAELERLERRVEVLELMMRRLLAPAAGGGGGGEAAPKDFTTLPEPRPPASRTASLIVEPASPLPRPKAEGPDLEQWFGQRGLLVVGVLALLTAAGLFLKYAIDRGWIAPVVRSTLAIIAGVGVAAWGEARIRHGLRRYGAAMIGAGGGLAYLGLWAAAGPYGLIERRLGVLLLAACTVVVILLALRHAVEGLAIWALAGAYLAPILLPPPAPNPEAFLGYLEVIGLGTGLLAYTMRWRWTFDLALAGYFVLAAAGAIRAVNTPLGCWFLAAGALLTLHVTRRRPWPEARLTILGLAWILLGVALADLHAQERRLWLAFAAAVAVAGLLWWQELDDPSRVRAGEETVLFVLNPFVLIGLAALGGLPVVIKTPGLLPALLATVYVAVGWLRRTAPYLMMGFALAAFALAVQADASAVVAGWTAFALAALVVERQGGRPGGRWAALGLAVVTFPGLFGVALWSRAAAAPAFSDGWALGLYAYIAGLAIIASAWEKAGRGVEPLWVLCGAAVFAGGSIELERYFAPRSPLGADLALSVFWLVYAGALVRLGFSLPRKDVRSAGLVVAAGTGLKIVLYDLSNLQALYRIASFFALALIALGVAYAYNKRASSKTVEERR